MDNGDESSKEVYKFRGRVFATKYPLVSVAWFFDKNKLNSISDKGISESTIKELAKRINGGYNSLEHRISETKKFAKILIVK